MGLALFFWYNFSLSSSAPVPFSHRLVIPLETVCFSSSLSWAGFWIPRATGREQQVSGGAGIKWKGGIHVAQTCWLLEALVKRLAFFSFGKEKVGRRWKSEEWAGRAQTLDEEEFKECFQEKRYKQVCFPISTLWKSPFPKLAIQVV